MTASRTQRLVTEQSLEDGPAADILAVDIADPTSVVGEAVAAAAADAVPTATTTVQGKAELATNAETLTGTDTGRTVTPAGVKAVVDPIRNLTDATFVAALSASYAPTQSAGRHPLTGWYHVSGPTTAPGFGAKGDWNGTTGTDDTTAIQAAITAAGAAGGGIVYLEDKAYKHTGLTIPSKVSLVANNAGAQGPAQARLVYKGTAGGTAIGPANRAADTINWGIKGIFIDGGGLAAIGVEFYRVSYSRMEDVLLGNIASGGTAVVFDSNVTGAAYFNVADNCKVDGVDTGVRFKRGANVNRWQGGAIVACGTSVVFESASSGNLLFGTDMENATVKHIYMDAVANVVRGCHFENAPIGIDITTNGQSLRRGDNQFASTVTVPIQDANPLPSGAALDQISQDTFDLILNTLRIRSKVLSGSTQVDIDPFPITNTANVLVRMFRNVTTSGTRTLTLHKGDGTATQGFLLDFGTATFGIGDVAVGGMVGGVGIANGTTEPTSNPTGGADFWARGGALKGRTSSGTIKTILGDTVAVSADYTVKATDSTILMTTGSTNRVVTLPVSINGARFVVKKVDSGTGLLTLNVTSGGLIDGVSSRTIYVQNGAVTVEGDGTGYLIVGAVGMAIVDTFTSSGTWTKRPGARLVRVLAIGAGGGGGSARRGAAGTVRCGGGGGGGGAVSEFDFDPSLLGATEAVSVGAGGTGGAAVAADDTNGSAGGVGNASTFGSHVSAGAGSGGGGGTNATGSAGFNASGRWPSSSGGAASVSGGAGNAAGATTGAAGGGGAGGGITTGNAESAGGAGIAPLGRSSTSTTAGTAGGGAGAAGASAPANQGQIGAAGAGGGSSITTAGGAGGAGGGYGGGGGGGGASLNGNASGAGGAGGAGIVIVTTWF